MKKLGKRCPELVEGRKCYWCPVLFFPKHQLKERQRSCGSDNCKRKQNLFCQKNWKNKNREVYFENQKDWRKDHPDYWRNYRKKNPKYVRENRDQSRIRKALKSGLQKKLDILEVTEKTMEYWNLPRFAKQTRSLNPLLWAYTGPHVESHPS